MKSLKWIGIVAAVLVVLVIVALLVVPMFVDLNDYKPQIEKQVSQITGRSFSIGGDIDLSLFPWAGISVSDVRLGNPAGFAEKEMVSLDAFEVRVKLLPLISRDVQVKRFVVRGPRVLLIRQKDGRANWEGFGGSGKEEKPKSKETSGKKPSAENLPIEKLAVGEFAVLGGSARFVDRKSGAEHAVSDMTLRLTDVSLDQPVQVNLSAKIDEKPISLEGTIGPVGRHPGKGEMPFDLVVKALSQVETTVEGKLIDAATAPRIDTLLAVAPFSPRKLFEALGRPFPLDTRDPEVFKKLAVKTRIRGNADSVRLSDGVLTLDDSSAKFSAEASEFEKPRAAFDLALDRLDADRYLPPEKKGTDQKKAEGPEKKKAEKPDYGPLRRLVLKGSVKIGSLKAAGTEMKDVRITVSAKNGVLKVEPLAMAMYGGDVTAGLDVDVRTDRPETSLKLGVDRLAINPLLGDLLGKDFLEGMTSGKIALSFAGDNLDSVLNTLAGDGVFQVKDGAVKGIDLAGMVRNVKSAFDTSRQPADKPRTDFTELTIPFSVKNGVASTAGAVMKAPFFRLKAAGSADLAHRKLEFRIDPSLVGSLKGQGDIQERSGLTVPIAVTGSFSAPNFAPDLQGAVKKELKGLGSSGGVKGLLPSQKNEGDGESTKPLQDLIKSLPFGGKN